MPLSDRSRQAIVAAYGQMSVGRSISTGDTDFWRQFGLPPWRQRNLILQRASALMQGSAVASASEWTGGLADIFAGTGYGSQGSRFGPAESLEANVRGRVLFYDPRPTQDNPDGTYTYRTYSKSFSWNDSLGDVYDDLQAWKAEMAKKYGIHIEDGDPEGLMIY